jgi:hypothetical protein
MSDYNQTFTVPFLEGDFISNGSEVPQIFSDCKKWPLKQHWSGSQPKELAHAFIAHNNEGIRFYTWNEEKEPFTTATKNDQRLWELGSVNEFFVKGIDDSYWEVHIAPNGLKMDIKIKSAEALLLKKLPWQDLIAYESNMSFKTYRGENFWTVDLLIPWKTFGFNSIPNETWSFSVCRYNYPGKCENSEKSSISDLTELNFHRVAEFQKITF